MHTTVAIIQSNYIPWKGYFDIIHDVDMFIFLDNVAYTHRDWRNRNCIKTSNGLHWLTVPVGSARGRVIDEVIIQDHSWQFNHWQNIRQYYSNAPHFSTYRSFLEEVYTSRRWTRLSELNRYLIQEISTRILELPTQFVDARYFNPQGHKLDLIIDILMKSGCRHYVTGPNTRDYIVTERFEEIGVELIWKDYSGYPEYPQFFPPFDHAVSILDLLLHVGPDAPQYIWGSRRNRCPGGAVPEPTAR